MLSHYRPKISPLWRSQGEFSPRLSAELSYWLFDSGSLTTKLQHHFGPLRLEILSERRVFASLAQAKALGLPVRSALIEREIELHGDQGLLIAAISLLPFTSLQGANGRLRLHRQRPLGHILYRLPLQRPVPKAAWHQGYWQRCSTFQVAGKPLLIYELFSPLVCPYEV